VRRFRENFKARTSLADSQKRVPDTIACDGGHWNLLQVRRTAREVRIAPAQVNFPGTKEGTAGKEKQKVSLAIRFFFAIIRAWPSHEDKKN
jgi:hypothetical protein